ncbi:MAG TPA: hypothetical protein VH500_12930 [Nitrososphaeraceae archaeon]|jgi:hypothetical protein
MATTTKSINLRYIITDFYQKSSTIRAVPIELIDMQKANTTYNIRRYTELLSEACNSVRVLRIHIAIATITISSNWITIISYY